MWYFIAGVFGLLALGVGTLYVLGRRLPADHVVTATLKLKRPVQDVHALIVDIASWDRWDVGINKIERLESEGECTRIRMHMGRNSFVMKLISSESPRSIAIHACDDHGFFEGRWEYEIGDADDRTVIKLTEYGRVQPAIPRAMLKLFADPAMYLKRHLKMVATAFSEPAEITDAHRIS